MKGNFSLVNGQFVYPQRKQLIGDRQPILVFTRLAFFFRVSVYKINFGGVNNHSTYRSAFKKL